MTHPIPVIEVKRVIDPLKIDYHGTQWLAAAELQRPL
jgi:hypothetical protein